MFYVEEKVRKYAFQIVTVTTNISITRRKHIFLIKQLVKHLILSQE